VRRQPVRIAGGRFDGGYTGLFELICPGCGDHPYLDYSEIPPRLQWLRGPRTLEAALVAYDKHLGPLPGLNRDSAGSLGPHAATKVTLTSAEITAEWFVSAHAGKSQQASRYRKLGTSSRSQEVSRARQLGLLEG
jgi:hypothetical protein